MMKVVSLGYKGIMKDRVKFEIRKLLKQKKIALPNGTQNYVSFAYEKLTLFCFLYGRLGHGSNHQGDMIENFDVNEKSTEVQLRRRRKRFLTKLNKNPLLAQKQGSRSIDLDEEMHEERSLVQVDGLKHPHIQSEDSGVPNELIFNDERNCILASLAQRVGQTQRNS
ncbi:hypothetical protein Gotri_005623 [Gossypium trilobum]|uniref:Zinc knuckle CX2CX4HX4C domain-containing protein n=1 Tax=Gossypium trilobum TaxID=34281 RepID=A0A7J9EX62_9ROSI|nr:hypothetical protein [Gossypium trilobum]